ncbi:MAG: DNA-binding protein [Phycisphaerae bacterium]|nr:DNA-binding protein [Phycisphaerae bacterium]
MNRNDLQEISRLRRREAKALLKARHSPGAYYLAGYSVECALKASIAKHTKRHDFPDKKIASKVWVHNLEELIKLAALWLELEQEMKANKRLEENWAVIKEWKESTRYDANISKEMAENFYSACTARKHGILSWIKKRW